MWFFKSKEEKMTKEEQMVDLISKLPSDIASAIADGKIKIKIDTTFFFDRDSGDGNTFSKNPRLQIIDKESVFDEKTMYQP